MASPTLSRHTLESYSLSRILSAPPLFLSLSLSLALSLSEHLEKIQSRGCRRRRETTILSSSREPRHSGGAFPARELNGGGVASKSLPKNLHPRGAAESSKRSFEAAAGEIIMAG